MSMRKEKEKDKALCIIHSEGIVYHQAAGGFIHGSAVRIGTYDNDLHADA